MLDALRIFVVVMFCGMFLLSLSKKERHKKIARRIWTEYLWFVHNMIAHPFMQVCRIMSLFGLIKPIARIGDWIHDHTVPHAPIDVAGLMDSVLTEKVKEAYALEMVAILTPPSASVDTPVKPPSTPEKGATWETDW